MTGRLDALAPGLDTQVMISVRQILAPQKSLSLRHSALARLQEASDDLGLYLTRLLASDPHTGAARSRMSKYSIVGPLGDDGLPPAEGVRFMEALRTLDFARADWLASPGGLSALLAARDSRTTPTVYLREDAYTCVLTVEELCSFIHNVVVGLGCANTVVDTVVDGLTFRQ